MDHVREWVVRFRGEYLSAFGWSTDLADAIVFPTRELAADSWVPATVDPEVIPYPGIYVDRWAVRSRGGDWPLYLGRPSQTGQSAWWTPDPADARLFGSKDDAARALARHGLDTGDYFLIDPAP